MERAHDGQVVLVATRWRAELTVAVVIEARFATCTVRYLDGMALHTHEWCDVHQNREDALNRHRALRRQSI